MHEWKAFEDHLPEVLDRFERLKFIFSAYVERMAGVTFR